MTENRKLVCDQNMSRIFGNFLVHLLLVAAILINKIKCTSRLQYFSYHRTPSSNAIVPSCDSKLTVIIRVTVLYG